MHASTMLRPAAATLALLLLLAAPAVAQQPTPDPGYPYRVVGVAANDVLNVRAHAGTDGRVVGRLPPGAASVVVTGAGQDVDGARWWEVVSAGAPRGTGWVNARFLAPVDTSVAAEGDFPLLCVGAEPFWSLSIRGQEARYAAPGEDGIDESAWRASPWLVANPGWRFAVRLEGEEAAPGWVAVLRADAFCTDGMSEVDFPYDTVAVTPAGQVLAGCCSRAP